MKWQCRILLLALLYLASEVRCEEPESEPESEPEPEPPNLNALGVVDSPCGPVEHCDSCMNPFHTCLNCEYDHIISADTQHCFKCPDNCAEGECFENAANNGAECRECELTYYLTATGSCQSCPGGCEECEEENGLVVCSNCGQGTFINTEEVTCLQCPNYCLRCESSTNCELCQDGFYRDTSGSCQPCPGVPNCLECTSTACTECASSMYWDGTTCSNCMDLCLVCVDDTTCEECLPGYFLSADYMQCLPITDCEEYDLTGGLGCTLCDVGKRPQEDLTCDDCPIINVDNCGDCPVNGRGRYWDQDDYECKYCPDNCMSCHLDGTDVICDWCAEDMVWNMNQCEACSSVTLTDSAVCAKCNRYYDGSECVDCPVVFADLETDQQCMGCMIDDKTNFYTEGICSDLDCSDLSLLDENQCNMCPETLWDGSDCLEANCTGLPSNSEECEACQLKAWEPSQCIPVMCMGEFNQQMSCEECGGQYWDDAAGTCKAVDCASADTQEKCLGCLGYYWDGAACTEIADVEMECLADPGSLAEDMCLGCRIANLYWDGAECLSIDCAQDPLDTEAKCLACPGMFYDGADCLETAAEGLCQGTFDSEAKCVSCFGRFWNMTDETCIPADCTSPDTEEVCLGCHWFWNGEECLELDCDTVSTEPECDSCHFSGKYWNEECLTMDPGAEAMSAAQCKALPTKSWMAGYCVDVDCTDPSLLSEMSCADCDGFYWDDDLCKPIDCTATIEDAMICMQCEEKYWDGTDCVDMFDCATDIINDMYRCHACITDPAAPMWWDTSSGQCWQCPDECLSCDQESCTQCIAGKVWSAADMMCIACSTASVDEDACGNCAGFWWDGTASACTSCGEGCISCENDIVCDVCSPGTTWDYTDEMCVDCMYETELECKGCGEASRGKFLDSEGLCRDCPSGCSECESYVVCTECFDGYYDEELLCYSCTGALLDTPVRCATCGGVTKYWNAAQGTCDDCIEFCMECTGADQCSQCAYGRYFDGDSCENCAANCLQCATLTDCSLCSSGRYWDGTACSSCDVNCAACDTEDGCQACNSGYYLDGQTCKSCLSNCDLCQDDLSCDLCDSNYCWDEVAALCQYTVNYCYECLKDSGTGIVSCLSCQADRFLDVCNACEVSGCKDCQRNSAECDECYSWLYYDDAADECRGCPGDYCSECEEDGSKCKTCNSGYYWSDSEVSCTSCGDNCAECTDATSCDTCVDDMYKDGRDCRACMDDCDECSEAATCATCDRGFYYDSTSDPRRCLGCPADCAECSTATGTLQCTECEHGYFQKQDGSCAKCSDQFGHCVMCKDENNDDVPECHWCDHSDGYVLSDDMTSCVACSVDNCYMCIDPPPYCQSCSTGFVKTVDWQACEYGCPQCEGQQCLSEGNVTLEACPGMGVTHDCWEVTVTENKEEYIQRGCHETVCENKKKECNHIDADKKVEECKRCCTGHACETKGGATSTLPGGAPWLLALMLASKLLQWLIGQ